MLIHAKFVDGSDSGKKFAFLQRIQPDDKRNVLGQQVRGRYIALRVRQEPEPEQFRYGFLARKTADMQVMASKFGLEPER